VLSIGFCLIVACSFWAGAQELRRLPVKEYRQKMEAGWIGQMAGVGLGAPTEFKSLGQILAAEAVPRWRPETINQFAQDDLYVEMTFLRTLEQYGLEVSIEQAGIDFANSTYGLWHANKAGRLNLRNGIAPPDSGHPQFNIHADDIDYQIEADFSGLIAPGMPNMAIALGEKFGRMMNYGDGVYGGQFVGGMYAEAFFETEMGKVIEAGLGCIPQQSEYAQAIRDVLRWHRQNPDDWQKTWNLINDKYQLDPEYRKFACSRGKYNIGAKINGAFVVMGLLYGQGDAEKTMVIAMRCGQDSDCNPSSAAGVLFTSMGTGRIPPQYTSALDRKQLFKHTTYSFETLIDVCEKLARQRVMQVGGTIDRDVDGQEVFVIPVQVPKPSELRQSWSPGAAGNVRYTADQMQRIITTTQPSAATTKSNGP
jgi:hypothetical protein